jgi:hypothetical protein
MADGAIFQAGHRNLHGEPVSPGREAGIGDTHSARRREALVLAMNSSASSFRSIRRTAVPTTQFAWDDACASDARRPARSDRDAEAIKEFEALSNATPAAVWMSEAKEAARARDRLSESTPRRLLYFRQRWYPGPSIASSRC